MVSKVSNEDKDIGEIAHQIAQLPTTGRLETSSLLSHKQKLLADIEKVIGARTVSGSQVSFAPPWVIEEAFKEEHDQN